MIRLLRILFPGRGRRRSADRCRELEREVSALSRMLLEATLTSCQDRVYLTLANEQLAADREQQTALLERTERAEREAERLRKISRRAFRYSVGPYSDPADVRVLQHTP